MAVTQAMRDYFAELLSPLKTKIANSIASAVIENVDDSKKMQLLQITALDGEVIEDCQRLQEFGFTSVPMDGAEALVVFPNGDRGNPIAVAVDDRAHRPTGWNRGESGTYNAFSAQMRHKDDGTTEVTGGGAAAALATKADLDALITTVNALVTLFNAHVHGGVTSGTAFTVAHVTPASSASASAGTSKLKGE